MLAAPSILAFTVEVVAVTRLSPSFVRITFAGDCLSAFHDGGPLGPRDLRVKIVVPTADGHDLELPELSPGWYRRWVADEPGMRDRVRTYTVRRARLSGPRREIDVDFVLHGDGPGDGPASTWAAGAEVGEQLTVIGPNAATGGYGGIEWQPPVAAGKPVRVLLAGDETAVPAISSVLESLPGGYHGHALVEVPCPEDILDIRTESAVSLTWLPRQGRPHGAALEGGVFEALADLGPPRPRAGAAPEPAPDAELLWEGSDPTAETPPQVYGWIAGEASTVRNLRRHLVRDLGVDRRNVAFMGYWRMSDS